MEWYEHLEAWPITSNDFPTSRICLTLEALHLAKAIRAVRIFVEDLCRVEEVLQRIVGTTAGHATLPDYEGLGMTQIVVGYGWLLLDFDVNTFPFQTL